MREKEREKEIERLGEGRDKEQLSAIIDGLTRLDVEKMRDIMI